MKIKFKSDDEIRVKKTIEIPSMIIVVTAVFLENNKNVIHKFSKMRVYINYE